jgi:hypothetical protein
VPPVAVIAIIVIVITQPGSNKEPIGARAFWMA